MDIIVGLIALVFIAYVGWFIVKSKGKLPNEGGLADKNDNNIPDGIDKLTNKKKKK